MKGKDKCGSTQWESSYERLAFIRESRCTIKLFGSKPVCQSVQHLRPKSLKTVCDYKCNPSKAVRTRFLDFVFLFCSRSGSINKDYNTH